MLLGFTNQSVADWYILGHRTPGMAAIAGNLRGVASIVAIGAAVFIVTINRTITSRMRAFFHCAFGHMGLPRYERPTEQIVSGLGGGT